MIVLVDGKLAELTWARTKAATYKDGADNRHGVRPENNTGQRRHTSCGIFAKHVAGTNSHGGTITGAELVIVRTVEG